MTAATDEFDLNAFDLDIRIDLLDPADPADCRSPSPARPRILAVNRQAACN